MPWIPFRRVRRVPTKSTLLKQSSRTLHASSGHTERFSITNIQSTHDEVNTRNNAWTINIQQIIQIPNKEKTPPDTRRTFQKHITKQLLVIFWRHGKLLSPQQRSTSDLLTSRETTGRHVQLRQSTSDFPASWKITDYLDNLQEKHCLVIFQ